MQFGILFLPSSAPGGGLFAPHFRFGFRIVWFNVDFRRRLIFTVNIDFAVLRHGVHSRLPCTFTGGGSYLPHTIVNLVLGQPNLNR